MLQLGKHVLTSFAPLGKVISVISDALFADQLSLDLKPSSVCQQVFVPVRRQHRLQEMAELALHKVIKLLN
jgi:hypothetical protein